MFLSWAHMLIGGGQTMRTLDELTVGSIPVFGVIGRFS